MLIKRDQTKKVDNSSTCTVWEYDYPSRNSSFGTSLINGRYPESGKVLNTECEELYFVISGSGTVHTPKGDFDIEQGDLYYFEANEPYWVEGNNLFITLFNSPKWSMEQHRVVE